MLDRGELTALLTELNDGNPVDPSEVEAVMFAPRRDLDSRRGLERCSGGATNLIEDICFSEMISALNISEVPLNFCFLGVVFWARVGLCLALGLARGL